MSKTSILFIVLAFFFAMSVGLAYTIYQVNVRKDDIFALRKEQEFSKVAQNLKSYIDIAYSAIDSQYKKSSMDQEYLEQHSGHRLKNVVEIAEMILKRKSNQVNTGQLTLAEAQVQAIEEIEQIRYDDGAGYIMINDTTLPYPKMIMHPTQPSLNGQIMDDPKYNNTWKKKKNLFVAFVEATQQHGEGFVIYLTSKSAPKGDIFEVPKLAYVKLFPQWNWIIGTDIYIGDIIIQSMNEIKEAIRSMRYNDGSGYFWIIDIPTESAEIPTTSFPKYIMHPIEPSRENKALDGKLSQFRTRVEAFINVCKKEGSGYVEYHGEKTTIQGTLLGVPKLTYVRLYEPLGWIIGTGTYLDSIEQSIIQEKKFLNQQVRHVISRLLATAFFMMLFVSTLGYAINRKFKECDIHLM